jgi:hypothetical protein
MVKIFFLCETLLWKHFFHECKSLVCEHFFHKYKVSSEICFTEARCLSSHKSSAHSVGYSLPQKKTNSATHFKIKEGLFLFFEIYGAPPAFNIMQGQPTTRIMTVLPQLKPNIPY